MHPLHKFILERDLSFQEFIDRFKPGLSRSFLSDVCHGKRNLSKGSAVKISQITGIPAEILIFPEAAHKYANVMKEHCKTKDAIVCKHMQTQYVTDKM